MFKDTRDPVNSWIPFKNGFNKKSSRALEKAPPLGGANGEGHY